jgi:hypothetical protein
MVTRFIAVLALCPLILAQNVKNQPGEKPPSVSRSLPALLPPPPPLDKNAPPAPPPPPPSTVGYPKHYEFTLNTVWAQGMYQDFQLPPGQILSMKWVAIGPNNLNVSDGVEVYLQSPSLSYKLSPGGASTMVVGSGGANMRMVATAKTYKGAFRVTVSIDLGALQ